MPLTPIEISKDRTWINSIERVHLLTDLRRRILTNADMCMRHKKTAGNTISRHKILDGLAFQRQMKIDKDRQKLTVVKEEAEQ